MTEEELIDFEDDEDASSVRTVSVTQEELDTELTNLDFASRLLNIVLRGYFRTHSKWLIHKLSRDVVDLFLDICEELGTEDPEPEVLGVLLEDLGILDFRKEVILKNYRLLRDDTSGLLVRSTYNKFRELVYQAYFESINKGNAVETLEAIQSDTFFLPPYNMLESETFKQVQFGGFDLNGILEDLGSPLYSHFKEINAISPIKGYIPSQVTMVSGPPGCFIGSTLVTTRTGVSTIHHIYQGNNTPIVRTLNLENGRVTWTKNNNGVQLIGRGKEFIQIFVNTNPDFPITCTRNHKFLILNPIHGWRWKEAQELQTGDILVSYPMERYVRVISVVPIQYNREIPYYDIVDCDRYTNYFINVGSEDICVHNSGKTLFMMCEAVEALKQGKRVLYAAIGDLKPFDFVSRICSMMLQSPLTRTVINLESAYATVCKMYPYIKENLIIQFISPNQYTPNEWYKMLVQMNLVNSCDVFFIDYDTNFATTADSMYAKGDEVYTMAYTLSQRPGKYVFIGSQPKIGNWKDDELGLETASESSRKQQIVDVMITLSHDRKVKNPRNHIGIINVPKNRRGGTTSFSYFMDPTGIMMSITPEAKVVIREESEVVSVINTELYDKSTLLLPNAVKE